jgi:hypothetical protein
MSTAALQPSRYSRLTGLDDIKEFIGAEFQVAKK